MRTTRRLTAVILAHAAIIAAAAAAAAAAEAQDRRPTDRSSGRAVARPAAGGAGPARAVIRARPLFGGVRFHRPYLGAYAGFHPFHHGPYLFPYGYGPYGYGPYGYGPWLAPAYGGYGYSSAVRLEVDPEETEVYVDGYYTGVVDSFDGFLQRLRLPPGEHEIELYLEGHESVRQTLYLAPGETYRIRHRMQPLPEGAPPPVRPEPPEPPPSADAWAGSPAPLAHPAAGEEFGTLVVRVRPLDAVVTVDGERWVGHEGMGELVLDLGAGVHALEVSRTGHRTYAADVEVVPGERTVVNVGLPREDDEP